MSESGLGRAYRRLYEALCGRHPNFRLWHFQWLSSRILNQAMTAELGNLGGDVLDVGCGHQPYRQLFKATSSYVGLDITFGASAHVLASVEHGLPFQDASFDVVLMSQVLEYLSTPGRALEEIRRVLRPGGRVVLSYPFLFNEHGPGDLIRLSGNAPARLFPGLVVIKLLRQGGIGSTLTVLGLNWLNASLNLNFPLRLTRPFLLPFWLPLCFLANGLALVLDLIDRTDLCYVNVFVVLKKPAAGLASSTTQP